MSHLPQIDYDTASQEVRAAHDEEVTLRGRMTNMKRTLLHSPAAHRIYAEWFTLRAELDPVLNDREIWIFSQAISKAAKSKIAITFFRRALISKGFNPDALELSEEEALLDAFGKAIVVDSNAVPTELWVKLKERYETKVLVDFDPELEAFAEGANPT